MDTSLPDPRRLRALFADSGREIAVDGHTPLSLDTDDRVWLVTAGKVEIFAVRKSGPAAGARTHIATIEAGEMLLSVADEDAGPAAPFGFASKRRERHAALLALGLPGTRLLEARGSSLTQQAQEEANIPVLTAAIERWLARVLSQVRRRDAPQHYVELLAGGEARLDDENPAARSAEGVVWVRHLQGSSRFLGRETLGLGSSDFLIPISDDSWLVGQGATLLSCVATAHLLRNGTLWEGMNRFHQLFLDYLDLELQEANAAERRRLERKLELDRAILRTSNARLASVLNRRAPRRAAAPAETELAGSPDPLLLACRRIGERLGLDFQAPPASQAEPNKPGRRLARICAASRVRYRRVLLRDDWWRRDNGPLLGFLEERPVDDGDGDRDGGNEEQPVKHHPVALLPTSPSAYVLVQPESGETTPLDEETTERLSGIAYMFYERLPERALDAWDLLRMAFRNQRKDLTHIVLMGAAGGLLALLVPIITGQVFGRVIPSADRGQLAQMTLALVVAALAGAAFQITRSIAVLRLTGKIDGTLQTAILDRLLSLPIWFYRRYTTGDLSTRALGIDTIRNLLLGNATTAALAAVFSLFSVALLFYYSWRLALVACGLIGLLLAVTVLLASMQLKHQRAALNTQGQIASLLFGLIRGIAKLRTSGSETRAYALWTERFAEQRRHTIGAQKKAILQGTFNSFYPLLSALGLFAMMGFSATLDLEVSSFLAFNAAFGQFQAAMLTFVPLISTLLAMAPIYERLKPILQTLPEVDETKAEAGELSGEIELSHLCFRYHDNAPLTLDQISLHARPGEFIALVGPSGSGKSTCLRLILGFEQPLSGSIYFDGQDLPSLDIQSIRRQIGVVLQDSKPMSGDIFRNIIGNTNLGIDAAWEAARMAGLEDDIKEMPMGMHTVISESAGTFSGGQLQRLLIARAVANRPRILIFDEATSALDNRTQQLVSESIERLKATRIVIAHRLSTVQNADRIYVLDKGRITEVGTYDELIALGGTFAALAARQMA